MQPRLSLHLTVKELMDRHPQVLKRFMDLGLMCVGCPTEAFHTLTDVAREYGLDPDQLLHRLQHAIEETVAAKGPKP
jgi:hybrid cluster-associated redox disulfide protein